MPDPPRKPESSRAFETHADDSKPTGIRRYINILAIVVPILIALVLVLIIVHSLNEPASNPSPTASTEPTPTPTTPPPTPTAESTPPSTTPTPKPAVATLPKPAPPATPPPTTAPAASPAADPIVYLSADDAGVLKISGDQPKVPPLSPADLAALAAVNGIVCLDAIISKTGAVQEVQPVGGPNLVLEPTFAAAKTNRYKPYLLDGRPVRVHTQICYHFTTRTTPPATPPPAAPK